MAVLTPPYSIQDASHTAQGDRQLPAAVFGAPVQTLTAGISLTTAGGGHGVIGDGLAVTEKSGTPDMSVDVAAGSAAITGTSSLAQGVYSFTNDAVTNLAVATADGSNDRKDLVIAQVRDDDEDAGGINDARLTVVTGTPDSSPADPTVPAGALVLARILVPQSTGDITDEDITDLRMYAAPTGGIQRAPTTALLPSGVSLFDGYPVFDLEDRRLKVYDGTNWVIVGGTWPQCNVTRTVAQSLGDGTADVVEFGTSETEITDTDGFKGPTDDIFTIPTGLGGDYLVTGYGSFNGNSTGSRMIQITIGSNTSVTGELAVIRSNMEAPSNASTDARAGVSKLVRLEAGATLTLQAFQNSGGVLDLEFMSLTCHMVRHVPTLT